MHPEMKLFVHGRDAKERFSSNLMRVSRLDFLEIRDKVLILKTAELGKDGFDQLVSHHDFTNFDKVQSANEHTAPIWENGYETLGNEATDGLPCGGPAEFEMIAEERLVELASWFQAHINNFQSYEVDRRLRLRSSAALFHRRARRALCAAARRTSAGLRTG
jgi:hypothetical protein